MNKIITISREFGSGGRELGKRLAKILNIAYYDHEIITMIASKSGLEQNYVDSVVDNIPFSHSIISGRTLSNIVSPLLDLNVQIYARQREIVREIASKSDCLIIGRCSDYLLRDYNPFNIFVYADVEARLQRCRQNAPEGEDLSDAELKNKILTIDKNRAKYYKFFTSRKWGQKENYHLCLNTSGVIHKEMAMPLSELLKVMTGY
ncbi:MAG TPA: cytidylate kinase-like family protein [Porphyromonadaceae bacterium]|jgi:cytidylate kinase|uniref:cytidylate kinase-like family protein n=1 Tax=Limibacterium fermenti TaxID=3229863 RepID=UPI000E96258E|nr:cytidylate kinase-like family protein [Porphyromonadaceae bacterium]HBL33778.1 cytidylate kinase-like family protein [Porphyromonadaceae bacterium]HBX19996.1 cytidylate kinase-like family protein [Porphyromonadaceae bacterium]HBX45629.1 cytidylate kinase-like family protein [Porphyromonadaceae bacterium]HCM22258.1 cytidylate kinase-like family protein [Porphyromonadaceae bacterium]